MSKTRKSGHLNKQDITRTIPCNFCGGEHRRKSKEQRECRRRGGKKPAEPAVRSSAPREQRTPSTVYQRDPLGGDKRAHAIAKKLRNGWPARRVAKHLGIPLDKVDAVARKLRV